MASLTTYGGSWQVEGLQPQNGKCSIMIHDVNHVAKTDVTLSFHSPKPTKTIILLGIYISHGSLPISKISIISPTPPSTLGFQADVSYRDVLAQGFAHVIHSQGCY